MDVRFATFNASLNRNAAGQLVADLSTPDNAQARTVAEIIQRTSPDVLLVNEFDFVEDGVAAELFRDNYLEVSQNGADAGRLPLLLRSPVEHRHPDRLRPQQQRRRRRRRRRVRVRALPRPVRHGRLLQVPHRPRRGPHLPELPLEGHAGRPSPTTRRCGADRLVRPEELDIFRLSSKSHWDVPIKTAATVHFLVTHPTPPTFDGPRTATGAATTTRSASGPTTSAAAHVVATSMTTRAARAASSPASSS